MSQVGPSTSTTTLRKLGKDAKVYVIPDAGAVVPVLS
jgi:hypothetical protein